MMVNCIPVSSERKSIC